VDTSAHPIVAPVSGGASTSAPAQHVKQKRIGVVRFVKRLGKDALADSIDDVGAMMAYYAVLALFPMLIFVVVIGLLALPEQVIAQGMSMALRAVPRTSQPLVTEQLTKLIANAQTGFAIGTAAFALWGASRGAVALGNALNRMFNIEDTRSWIRRQLTALAVTIGLALLLVCALALLVVGPIAGHWIADRFGLGPAFDIGWSIGRWIGAGVLVMVVWAVIYRFLPDTRMKFRVFSAGAFVGVFLWLAISWLFGVYLDRFANYQSTYGTLGSGIAFLTWLWLSNISLLLGAEINDVFAALHCEDAGGGDCLSRHPSHRDA
jgi:membrane protein